MFDFKRLALHRHYLAVDENTLLQRLVWNPMNWQLPKGASSMPMKLFEVVAELDAGPIHLQQQMTIQGHDLVDEWRALQPRATFELCLTWLYRNQEEAGAAKPQRYESSHYPGRQAANSEIDPQLSLAQQFNFLGVADNQRHDRLKRINSEYLKITNNISNHQSFFILR